MSSLLSAMPCTSRPGSSTSTSLLPREAFLGYGLPHLRREVSFPHRGKLSLAIESEEPFEYLDEGTDFAQGWILFVRFCLERSDDRDDLLFRAEHQLVCVTLFLTRNLLWTLSHSLTGILEPHGCAVNRSMLLIGEFIDGGSVRDLPTPAGALRRVHIE